MTSLQVQYFLQVAESMSFSKAAEELYVSQPSVSRQVQLLEQELGFSLFDRSSKRNLAMTPAGWCSGSIFSTPPGAWRKRKKPLRPCPAASI